MGNVTVNDVYSFLKSVAPLEMAMEGDNVGFLVGTSNTEVTKILVALDITSDVVDEALNIGAELIVSHHPLYFSIDKITDETMVGKKIIDMISGGVSAICMHTNLDSAKDGVNDALATAAGIVFDENFKPLSDGWALPSGEIVSLGKIGHLAEPCEMADYLVRMKGILNTGGIRYHDAGREVYRVAVAAGSGGGRLDYAINDGCDTFVTGEVKYSHFLFAKEHGINLVEGDHFCTENLISPVVANKLSAEFPSVKTLISEVHTQTIKFL
ncbi:MAG: Nif3-like dinuclear metal center hexameric protein [Oscillospiraceae bacterium]|nr:Nif3-like dinuclear metal center hexameric protein [Oscillospiraceae bacterium]